jgi:metallophosphoesterase (TIGR00282 family)
MKLIFCGDVMGKAGRQAILDHIPDLRQKLGLDFVVVNGENAAHGFGITPRICRSFYEAGVDVITTGNHIWDRKEILNFIDEEPRLLRPLNYPQGSPGRGAQVYETGAGKRVLVVQAMGKLFMPELDDPFIGTQAAMAPHRLGETVDCVIVDVHAEANSEKMAFGHWLDGRASLVVGSHCHIPTADTQILPGGTAYHTDAGMCGDYDSVIGMTKEAAVARFVMPDQKNRLEPAEGEGTLCGVYVETDDATGLAVCAAPLRLGGRLAPQWPV